jgi:hypothetical protein
MSWIPSSYVPYDSQSHYVAAKHDVLGVVITIRWNSSLYVERISMKNLEMNE